MATPSWKCASRGVGVVPFWFHCLGCEEMGVGWGGGGAACCLKGWQRSRLSDDSVIHCSCSERLHHHLEKKKKKASVSPFFPIWTGHFPELHLPCFLSTTCLHSPDCTQPRSASPETKHRSTVDNLETSMVHPPSTISQSLLPGAPTRVTGGGGNAWGFLSASN